METITTIDNLRHLRKISYNLKGSFGLQLRIKELTTIQNHEWEILLNKEFRSCKPVFSVLVAIMALMIFLFSFIITNTPIISFQNLILGASYAFFGGLIGQSFSFILKIVRLRYIIFLLEEEVKRSQSSSGHTFTLVNHRLSF